MKTGDIPRTALAVCLAISGPALAQGISKSEYEAGKEMIASVYLRQKADCETKTGNSKYVCFAEITGRDNVARAELSAAQTPTRRTRYDVAVARAGASLEVARERCNALSAEAKARCAADAKVVESSAMLQAKEELQVAAAGDSAAEVRRPASGARRPATGDPVKKAPVARP